MRGRRGCNSDLGEGSDCSRKLRDREQNGLCLQVPLMQLDAQEINLPVVPRSRDLESGGSPLPSLLFIAFRLPSPGLLPAHPVEAGGGGF